MRIVMLALCSAMLVPFAALAQQPYAGQQTREIKALSPEEIADLEAGRADPRKLD